ncbi:hypothetical protein D3C84_1103210 [compost metagenome]
MNLVHAVDQQATSDPVPDVVGIPIYVYLLKLLTLRAPAARHYSSQESRTALCGINHR